MWRRRGCFVLPFQVLVLIRHSISSISIAGQFLTTLQFKNFKFVYSLFLNSYVLGAELGLLLVYKAVSLVFENMKIKRSLVKYN